jgi:hypothetical protein
MPASHHAKWIECGSDQRGHGIGVDLDVYT